MTDQNIKEMAEKEYGTDPNLYAAQRDGYIKGATDAMNQWVSVETPPVCTNRLSDDEPPQYWQCATDDAILLLPCEYYKGKWHPYTTSGTEDRVRWYRPLPEAPVINKGK